MKTVTPKQMAKTLNLIADSNISSEQYQRLLECGKFTVLLQEFMSESKLSPTVSLIVALVNYDRSVKEGNKAGSYYWMSEDIVAAHFPFERSGKFELELKLVHFGRQMETAEVLTWLDDNDLRPAELPELQAIGEHHPELQREFPILAFGSQWRDPGGHVYVPVLDGNDGGRGLDLDWDGSDDGWVDIYRFVAVSK